MYKIKLFGLVCSVSGWSLKDGLKNRIVRFGLFGVGLKFERLIKDKNLLDPSLAECFWLELNEDDSLHGLPLIANPLGKYQLSMLFL